MSLDFDRVLFSSSTGLDTLHVHVPFTDKISTIERYIFVAASVKCLDYVTLQNAISGVFINSINRNTVQYILMLSHLMILLSP